MQRLSFISSDGHLLYVLESQVASRKANEPKKSVCEEPPVAIICRVSIGIEPTLSTSKVTTASGFEKSRRASRYIQIKKRVTCKITPSRNAKSEGPPKR